MGLIAWHAALVEPAHAAAFALVAAFGTSIAACILRSAREGYRARS